MLVTHSQNVSQAQATDPSRLPAFEVEYAGVAEAGRHQVKFKMTRGPEQLHVTIGAAVLEPQEGITTSLGGGEVRRMIRNFMREIVLVTDPPVWPTEVQVEIIATCVDVDPPNDGWRRCPAVAKVGGGRLAQARAHRGDVRIARRRHRLRVDQCGQRCRIAMQRDQQRFQAVDERSRPPNGSRVRGRAGRRVHVAAVACREPAVGTADPSAVRDEVIKVRNSAVVSI